ncbi:MAG: hypothetical protein OIF55_08920 [Amphritea sp.]|nr:hypothetical protein [Amphritea sp.]
MAYPSYQEHVMSSRRSAAQLCLQDMAVQMERRYASDLRYPDFSDQAGINAVVAVLNSACAQENDLNTFYRFTSRRNTAVTFVFQARPIAGQAGDRCGAMTVNQSGQRTPANNDCW